jgi:hypothetical protein
MGRSTKAVWREDILTEPHRALRFLAYHPGPLPGRFRTTPSSSSFQRFWGDAPDSRATKDATITRLISVEKQRPQMCVSEFLYNSDFW